MTGSELGSNRYRGRLIAGAIVLAAILLALWLLPLTEWLDVAVTWIDDHPASGRLLFVLLFVVGTLVMIPGSALIISGGYLFGLAEAVVLSAIGAVIGPTIACALARYAAREVVAEMIADSPRLVALDRALKHRAFVVIVLTRMSLMLPYNLLNYAYGLTRVPLRVYAIATGVGMLPAIVLYAYLGSISNDVSAVLGGEADIGWGSQALLAGGAVLLIAAVVVIHRAAGRELARHVET